ncbi:ABC transporter substrate-binding protein [Streptomyces sp. NPDC006477]|uniref:ABC transporter substrate-binding protein n=1 Tax=Streptomyces sp. NPDC006477 TaxID=3364747 RepID=UPI0036C69123
MSDPTPPRPDHEPGSQPAHEPGSRPDHEPGSQPAHEPGSRPDDEPGSQPEPGISSGPASGSQSDPGLPSGPASGSQSVMYVGTSPRRAALCAQALRDQGYEGPCGSVEAVFRPEFLGLAGPAAEGWYFGTAFADPDGVPAAKDFAAAYRKRWGIARTTPVDPYATEAYDAVHWTAQALGTAVGNLAESEAAGVANSLRQQPYQGLVRQYTAASRDTSVAAIIGLFLWQVKGGVPRFLGEFDKAAAAGT